MWRKGEGEGRKRRGGERYNLLELRYIRGSPLACGVMSFASSSWLVTKARHFRSFELHAQTWAFYIFY